MVPNGWKGSKVGGVHRFDAVVPGGRPRILLDLGVITIDSSIGDMIVTYSDLLAAPVEGIGNGLGLRRRWIRLHGR